MSIEYLNRRQFIIAISCAGTATIAVPAAGGDESRALYNVNYQTAIGPGDEPATVVDRFGQLKSDDANVPELANAARGGGSRNVSVVMEIGNPSRAVSNFQADQSLEDGYLPILHTKVRAQQGFFRSVVFSSDSGGIKADYLGIIGGSNPFRVRLLCPTTTLITRVWVRDAPTKFGTIDFNLRRSASVLTLEHSVQPNLNQLKPSIVRLHIPPPLRNEITRIRVNGRAYTLSPEESVLRID